MTILSVAYPFAPVSFNTSGGSEQVLAALDRELKRAGCRSIVIAQEGSSVAGTLLSVPRTDGPIDDDQRQRAHTIHAETIAAALRRFPVDLIHMHGLDFGKYFPTGDVPVLATLHLPHSFYELEAIPARRPNFWMNCVSWAQHHAWPAFPNLLDPVPNGIPLDLIKPHNESSRTYCLMLARICPEKGVHLAIEATRRAEMDLIIAGEVYDYPEHRRYFEQSVEPLLNRHARFVGPANVAEKRRLLAEARCLLIPSTVPETSSLVAMEAAACGTPVVAFAIGALSEVVEEGQTGFVVPVNDVEAMALAIRRSEMIEPGHCRMIAQERFDARSMAQQYRQYYRVITSQSNTSAHSLLNGYSQN